MTNTTEEALPTNEREDTNSGLQTARKFWPLFIGTLIVLGGHYLRSYLSSVNVPFPMELNVLATSLLLMGIASVLLILSLCSLLLFTAIIRMVPMDWNYNQLVVAKPSKKEKATTPQETKEPFLNREKVLTGLTLAYLVLLPIALVVLMFLAKTIELIDFGGYSLALYLVGAVFITSLLFAWRKESDENKFIVTLGFCFFIQISVAVVWTFPASIFIELGLISTNWGLAGLILALSALYIIGLIPSDESQETEPSNEFSFVRSVILRNPIPFLAFCMIAIMTILPPVSDKIGMGALRFFEVGGGIDHEISLTKELTSGLCGLGLEPKKESKTVRASLLFRVNDTSYYKISDQVITVNTKNLTINLSPSATKQEKPTDSSEQPQEDELGPCERIASST